MHHAGHRFAADLGVTMRDGDGDLLVHARDVLESRRGHHSVVDDRLVQGFERVTRDGRDILDAEVAHHIDHEVAAAGCMRGAFQVWRRTLFGFARRDLNGVARRRFPRSVRSRRALPGGVVRAGYGLDDRTGTGNRTSTCECRCFEESAAAKGRLLSVLTFRSAGHRVSLHVGPEGAGDYRVCTPRGDTWCAVRTRRDLGPI